MPESRLSDRIGCIRKRRRPYVVERGPSAGWHVFDRFGRATQQMTLGIDGRAYEACVRLANRLNGVSHSGSREATDA